MNPLARRTAVLLATTLTVGTLAACGSGSADSAGTASSSTTSSSTSTSSTASETSSESSADAAVAAGDIMFARMMIPHHEQAVEMSDLALDSSSGASETVRGLAEQIKSAQGPEIEMMEGWLEEWDAPGAMPSGMDHGGMGHGMMSDEDMSELESATGADFDEQWLTMMIDHHEGAVSMAEQVLETTDNSEVRQLAEDIISSQEAEIETMKGELQ